ncbi:MAG: PepSY-associated TM helix domain-containing protein [Bacteroidales bacterium]|nr:PepSY-associated TM helix domain-containing protein [Bacteroidales bacterium]
MPEIFDRKGSRVVRAGHGSAFCTNFRKWCRGIHREFSFFFAGVLCLYAVSGICLNHKRDFNSNITIQRTELDMKATFPIDYPELDKEFIGLLVDQLPDTEVYTRHAAAGEGIVKIFFKGGSSLEVRLADGHAMYEKVRRRPVLSALNRLHYNPSRSWTWFSDIFAVCLVLITLTGLLMLRGPKGLWGRGGIEFIAGLLVPLGFMLFL